MKKIIIKEEDVLNQRAHTKTYQFNMQRLAFIVDNEEDFIEIFNKGLNHTSMISRNLIAQARIDLGYSEKTCDVDIFRSLMRLFKLFHVA